MGLDIRWPIGLMFSLIRRAAHRLRHLQPRRRRHPGAGQEVNIDLIWGVVLLIFGVLMLLGAIRGGKNPPAA